MNIQNPQKRLRSLWGLIDRRHNELIARQLSGTRVLDIGCGYGSLVGFLMERGFDAEGWDADPAAIETARQQFPRARVSVRRIEDAVDADAGAFDSIVLKDALHHLAAEVDVVKAFDNICRLLRDGGRLVVTDPNPTWILRLARTLARHHDPEAPLELALQLLSAHGFVVRHVQYHEVFGLPLSGGYVGIRWVPNWRLLNRAIAAGNGRLSDALDHAGLGRQWCWRYLIAADLKRSGARI